MNNLREVVAELLKMFVGGIWLTLGILTVVSLAGLPMRSGTIPPLFGGAMLFLGCIVVERVPFFTRNLSKILTTLLRRQP